MSHERRTPRIIPVLDVMGGQVVRAAGGQRSEYRPITCRVSNSPRLYDIADGLAWLAATDELYVADLDAITGNGRVSPAVETLLRVGRRHFWVDAGTRSLATFRTLPVSPSVYPVIGSETCLGPAALTEIARDVAAIRAAFSIDLRGGELIGDWRAWGLHDDHDALGLAQRVVGLDIRTLIVLDLARVGTGTGPGTEPLLQAIRHEFPDVELIAGGGVTSWADIDRLGEAGANAVLVASALHDGTLTIPRPLEPASHQPARSWP